MKTVKLEITKRNRVYFQITLENGYKAKLRINEKSTHLEPGTHELLINDVSVRTKYGTDVIYEVEGETKTAGVITLKHRYNTVLIDRCRDLGGRWDSDTKTWVFSDIVGEQIEELDEKYNNDLITVDIEAIEDTYRGRGQVTFMGYPLCKASGRDSGAVVCDDVHMLTGSITSGGSMKNWSTEVAEGTIFRLIMSRKLFESALTGSIANVWKITEVTA